MGMYVDQRSLRRRTWKHRREWEEGLLALRDKDERLYDTRRSWLIEEPSSSYTAVRKAGSMDSTLPPISPQHTSGRKDSATSRAADLAS